MIGRAGVEWTTSTSTRPRGAGSSSPTRPNRRSSRRRAHDRPAPRALAQHRPGRSRRAAGNDRATAAPSWPGKTLGVLGFGRIGQQVARRARPGDASRGDPFVARERFRELGVDRVESSDDVLAAADFLTLHLPLTEETTIPRRAGAGEERDGVRVVNAARGELVDEDALLAALQSGESRSRRARRLPRSRTRARCSTCRTSSSRRISPPPPRKRRTGPA